MVFHITFLQKMFTPNKCNEVEQVEILLYKSQKAYFVERI